MNGVGFVQGQVNVIEIVQQVVFVEFVDVEWIDFVVIGGVDDLFFQVDDQVVIWEGFDFIEQVIDLLFGQDDGQQVVFVVVVEEDVGKIGCDYGVEVVLVQCLGCMFM